jgi:hypothetical protein
MDFELPAIAGDTETARTAPLGLTTQQAQKCLGEHGPNDPTPVKRGSAVVELVALLLNPLVIILLVAGLVSFVLGNAPDAVSFW